MSTVKLKTEDRLWRLSELGYLLHRLESTSARTTIIAVNGRPGVLDDVDLLRKSLAELDLAETDGVFAALPEIGEFFVFLKVESETRTRLTSTEAKVIRMFARRLFEELERESHKRTVFVAQRSRKNEIEQFLQNPRIYFGLADDTHNLLNAKGEEDFQEAARCYSVNFTDASIMFMLRGMEQVLRGYYAKVTDTPPNKGQNWGQLAGPLKLKILNCPQSIHQLLGELGTSRNQAMHPGEVTWTEQDAQKILNKCRRCIELMVKDLENRNVTNRYSN